MYQCLQGTCLKKKENKEKKKKKVPQVCWAICLVCFLHLSRSLCLSSQQRRMRKIGYWKTHWGKCDSLQRKTEKNKHPLTN